MICTLSCQIFHPIEAVDLNHSDKAFEDLIGFQAGENHPSRSAEESGDDRRRQDYSENEDAIVFKYEGNISSALHQAEEARRLIPGSDDGDADNVDQADSLLNCGIADAVK